jgi:hypothetical protein
VCNAVFLPGATPGATATLATTASNYGIEIESVLPNKAPVRIFLDAENPLTLFAPTIYSSHDIRLEHRVHPQNGSQLLLWEIEGERSRFPSHEWYINGRQILIFDPIVAQTTPFDLDSYDDMDPTVSALYRDSFLTSGPR